MDACFAFCVFAYNSPQLKGDEANRLLAEDKGEGDRTIKAKTLNLALTPVYDALEAKARAKGETPEEHGRFASQ